MHKHIAPTHDHVLSIPGSTFAFFWTNRFFQELREAYLKAKLGGHSRYELELEKLLDTARCAMPEGSAEREAFEKVDTSSIPENYKKCSELAKQLNDLAFAIFGRNLVPSSKDITVDYLVREVYSLRPDFYTPAYESWLTLEFRKKATKRSKKQGALSPLQTYVSDAACKLHNIVCNENLSVNEEFLSLLMKLSCFELDKNPENDELHGSKDKTIQNRSQEELKDLSTIKYLLTFGFYYRLQKLGRATELFNLLKALDEYQPNVTTED